MRRAVSCWLTLAGLVALIALLAWPLDAVHLIGVAPLTGLVLVILLAPAKWLIVTAILMLPYFSFGIMEAITDPVWRLHGMVIATLTVAVFLASMDSLRRGRARR